MSTAIIPGVVKCLGSVSEGDEEFDLTMLISTGKGRAEI